MSVLGTYDVVIIGGGACGGTTAMFLRRAGVSVALVDKSTIGTEASWASAGMVGRESCPQRDPWFLQATTLSSELYDGLDEQLFDLTGQHMGYGGEGHLLIARGDDDTATLHERVDHQMKQGVEIELLEGAEARRREPALPEDVTVAAWTPGGRYLDARRYTAAVAAAARQLGADIHEGQAVNGLVWNGDRVIGVRCGSDEMHAATVINAAGAWAGRIDPRLTHPVFPLHGQIMSVAAPACGLRHNVSRADRWGYATPRPDGRVVVGATHDEWGYEKKITPEGMEYLGQIVQNVMPVLIGRPVLDIWSGLRPGTVDGLPTIGPDPRVSSGYLWAAGHSSSGMMQMPATAKVLVDLVQGEKPDPAIDQLRIERYDDESYVQIAEPLRKIEGRYLSI